MQGRRHAPHHVEADEHRKHEDGKQRQEVAAPGSRLRHSHLGGGGGELPRLLGQPLRLVGELDGLVDDG